MPPPKVLACAPGGGVDDADLALVPCVEQVELVGVGAGHDQSAVGRFGGQSRADGERVAGGVDGGQRGAAHDQRVRYVEALEEVAAFPVELASEAQPRAVGGAEAALLGVWRAETQRGLDGEFAAGWDDVVGVFDEAEDQFKVGGVSVGGGWVDRQECGGEEGNQHAEGEEALGISPPPREGGANQSEHETP